MKVPQLQYDPVYMYSICLNEASVPQLEYDPVYIYTYTVRVYAWNNHISSHPTLMWSPKHSKDFNCNWNLSKRFYEKQQNDL